MDIGVPEGWVEIDPQEFVAMLKDLNYTRDGWGNGVHYIVNGKAVLMQMTDGRCYASNTFFKTAYE